tara:strand:- start:1556 stop:2131 length:576 start_codon:yes stop_codon:yes gene_type:complete
MMRLIFFLIVLLPLTAKAGWVLDGSRSEISFISIKNLSIAETHEFRNLSGTIDDEGNLAIKIPLSSVETKIPIRNERMKKMLFETSKFANALVTSKIDLSFSKGASVGEIIQRKENFSIDLHGFQQENEANVAVTLEKDGVVRVDSVRPVIVNASSHRLSAGIDALRVVAKLSSIAESVPVSFNLFFRETK